MAVVIAGEWVQNLTQLEAGLEQTVDAAVAAADPPAITPANVHDAVPVEDLLATHATDEEKPTVMGDCAYGTAETLERLAEAGSVNVAEVAMSCFDKKLLVPV